MVKITITALPILLAKACQFCLGEVYNTNDNSLRLYEVWDNSNFFIADGSEIWKFMARSGWRGIWFRGVLRGLYTLVHVLCWKPGCLRLEVLLAKLKRAHFC